MQVRWQCIREIFSLALDFISNNNNKSLFHQKIELPILCYNNTEDYNMEDIYYYHLLLESTWESILNSKILCG